MPSKVKNILKLWKLVLHLKLGRLLLKSPLQIVIVLLLVLRIHGFFVARVISRHIKMYVMLQRTCM